MPPQLSHRMFQKYVLAAFIAVEGFHNAVWKKIDGNKIDFFI
jgi:hypothetical protein